MENISIYSDKEITSEELLDIYKSVGWKFANNNDELLIEKAIQSTTSFVYARDENGLLIGLVRLFSDFVITTYIAEIIVRNEYQKMGIGKRLMKKVESEFGNTGIYFDTLPGIEGFAEKCGFIKRNKMTVYSNVSNN